MPPERPGFDEDLKDTQPSLRVAGDAAKNESLVGTTLSDRFEILESIGEGGVGTVYKARHKLIDKILAIKVLQSRFKDEENSMARFHREAKAASNLNHPNLVAVNDFGVTPDNALFIVMEFVEGKSLSDILKTKGPLSIVRFRKLFVQIASGLTHAHSKGVIHRDLKPTNIMIVDEGQSNESAKIVDFGIAKPIQMDEKARQITLTKTGTIFGSPPYMSPEQCQGLKVDHRSDIYSLGCTMYESLTGRPPFMSDSFLNTFMMHLKDKPQPLSSVRPDLKFPPELETLIAKCLEKSPDNRYQSMPELLHALEAVSFESEIQPKAKPKKFSDRLSSPETTAVLSVVLFIIAYYVLVNSFVPHFLQSTAPVKTQTTPASTGSPDVVPGLEEARQREKNLIQVDELLRRAGNAMGNKRFEEACDIYQQALAKFKEMPNGDVRKHCQILQLLGDAQREIYRWPECAANYDQVIELLKSIGDTSSKDMANALLRRGVVDFHTGHHPTAQRYLTQALALKESLEGKEAIGVAEIGGWLADSYRRSSPPDDEKAVEILRWVNKTYRRSAFFEAPPENADVYANFLTLEGSSLSSLHRYKELETRMSEALKDVNSLLTAGNAHKRILLKYKEQIQSLLAHALIKQGKVKEAEKVRPTGKLD